jgi:hypothetical protein
MLNPRSTIKEVPIMRYVALCVLFFTLAVLGVIAIGAAQDQKSDKVKQRYEAELKRIDEQLPVVEYHSSKPTEPAARAKRLGKDRRHNLPQNPPIGERNSLMTTVKEWDPNFPPLPIEWSNAIVTGTVSEATANISEDKTGVYSEVVVKVEEALKDTTGIGRVIVAERDGGRVQFPSGTIFRFVIDGLGIPIKGHRYLLFLKQLDDGDFSILTGYELLDGRVRPLDTTSVVPFAKYENTEESEFLSEVRRSIKHQTSKL